MGRTGSNSRRRGPEGELNLPPGFRFNPSDEELVLHYLCKQATSHPFALPIIAEVDLYKFNPWDLPDMALFGETEWYFFSPRDRKYPNGSRPNRSAGSGFWKATGTDKPICSSLRKVGVKKALVFYKGRAPHGVKTNWIMHEYRLPDPTSRPNPSSKSGLRLDDWVLCRIYEKTSSAQRRAKEEEERDSDDDVISDVVLAKRQCVDWVNGTTPPSASPPRAQELAQSSLDYSELSNWASRESPVNSGADEDSSDSNLSSSYLRFPADDYYPLLLSSDDSINNINIASNNTINNINNTANNSINNNINNNNNNNNGVSFMGLLGGEPLPSPFSRLEPILDSTFFSNLLADFTQK